MCLPHRLRRPHSRPPPEMTAAPLRRPTMCRAAAWFRRDRPAAAPGSDRGPLPQPAAVASRARPNRVSRAHPRPAGVRPAAQRSAPSRAWPDCAATPARQSVPTRCRHGRPGRHHLLARFRQQERKARLRRHGRQMGQQVVDVLSAARSGFPREPAVDGDMHDVDYSAPWVWMQIGRINTRHRLHFCVYHVEYQ